jgi:hypothetical protein
MYSLAGVLTICGSLRCGARELDYTANGLARPYLRGAGQVGAVRSADSGTGLGNHDEVEEVTGVAVVPYEDAAVHGNAED